MKHSKAMLVAVMLLVSVGCTNPVKIDLTATRDAQTELLKTMGTATPAVYPVGPISDEDNDKIEAMLEELLDRLKKEPVEEAAKSTSPSCSCSCLTDEQVEKIAKAVTLKLMGELDARDLAKTTKQSQGYSGYTLDYWTFPECGSCKVFNRGSRANYPDGLIQELNLYDNRSAADELKVNRFPTFILRDSEGHEVHRWIGDPSWPEVKRYIEKL